MLKSLKYSKIWGICTLAILLTIHVQAQLQMMEVPNNRPARSMRDVLYNPIDSQVYVCGDIYHVNQPHYEINLGVYKDNRIIDLDNDTLGPLKCLNGMTTPLRMHYHGGRFYVFGFRMLIYMDSSRTWHEIRISNHNSVGSGLVSSLYSYGDQLLIGGRFDSIGGIYTGNLAVFDGQYFKAFDESQDDSKSPGSGFIYSIQEYQNSIYVGGNFVLHLPEGRVDDLAKWDGQQWRSVGGSIYPPTGMEDVEEMKVYDGKLYVAGFFENMGGTLRKSLATWNGRYWETPLGSADNGLDRGGYIQGMFIDEDTMYFLGTFHTMGGDSAYSLARMYNGIWEYDKTYKGTSLCQMTKKDDTLFLISGAGGVRLENDTCMQIGNHCPYLIKAVSSGFREDRVTSTPKYTADKGNDIVLHPNPSQGLVQLRGIEQHNIHQIVLSNMLGQVLATYDGPQRSLDISEYSAGSYIVYFISGDGQLSLAREIILEH